ncbi:MAG: hypothetical protein LBR10_13850 [Prevotellaceae bacterium]|jgi:hypothetical protein|nr:hypothetical protein [Prevotellaceae bacterium]
MTTGKIWIKNLFIICSVLSLNLFSCTLEESNDYNEAFGVVEQFRNGDLYIRDDAGETLISTQPISSITTKDSRVWVSYTIENMNKTNDTLKILPYRVTNILSVPLQDASNINEDGIDIWSAWIAQNFLTFDFRIRAKNQDEIKNHEYALVLQPSNTESDTIFLNFRHDAKGDTKGVLCRTAIAVKLNELTVKRQFKIVAITYKDLNGFEQTIYRTYEDVKKF